MNGRGGGGVHAGKSGARSYMAKGKNETKKKKERKKGQSLENSIPGMGSGVQIVQYSVSLYRRDTLKGWIYAGGI
jgi:hypothetical protein